MLLESSKIEQRYDAVIGVVANVRRGWRALRERRRVQDLDRD
jgi:hypothetical protein